MTVVNGEKLLAILELPNNSSLTPEMVAKAIASLSEEERLALEKEVIIVLPNPYDNAAKLAQVLEDENDHTEYVPYKNDTDFLSDTEIRRKLKYEKNYMASVAMKRKLGPSGFTRGKHSKGKRHVKR